MKTPAHFLAVCATASLALAPAVAEAQYNKGPWEMPAADGVSALLDCHEEAGRTIISAHRGGPSAGLPENAIETMDAVLAAIPAIMEVDVAQSPDGVHYLMHDRTIDRTTTGEGSVTEVEWSEIEKLYLVDEAGWVTPYRVPTLKAALEWAKGRTVLQIDFKRTADYAEVIDLIRETGSETNVILIAYSLESASRMLELWPGAPLSLSLSDVDDLEAARIAEDLFDAMSVFAGNLRGGVAVQTVVVAVIMAAMSGIMGGEIVMLGLVALPQMLRLGYNRKLTIGVICASGSLATLIPRASS